MRVSRVFAPILAGATLRDRVILCVGAVLGILFTGLLAGAVMTRAFVPLLVAPIGASAVLLFAVPASPLAQPWPIIGGNTVSALVGIAVAHAVPSPAAAAGIAVGGAILVMSLLRCLHPPGGAAALTAVIGGPAVAAAGYSFALIPVALDSALLVMMGLIFHRFSGHSYPHRPVPVSGHVLPPAPPVLHPEDIDRALDDLGETFDVARADLEVLFRQVEYHSEQRRRVTR